MANAAAADAVKALPMFKHAFQFNWIYAGGGYHRIEPSSGCPACVSIALKSHKNLQALCTMFAPTTTTVQLTACSCVLTLKYV